MRQVQPDLNVHLFRTGEQYLSVTTDLNLLQFNFIAFIFIALGLVLLDATTPLNCAGAQNVPLFMSQQIIDNLADYKVKYGIIIHNRLEDTFPKHASVFLEWTARVNRELSAKIHIYPSRDMYDRGVIENALLTYLPRSAMSDNAYIPSNEFLSKWVVSPILKVINRETGTTLKFYIKHLFENRLSTDWLTEDSTYLGSNIIDIRGYLLTKANNYSLNLFPIQDVPDINNLPEALERFIDIVNETWLPVLIG